MAPSKDSPAGRGRRSKRKKARAPETQRRSFVWRWRRGLYLLGLLGVAGLSGVAFAATRLELPATEVPDLSSVVCGADVTVGGCTADNAMARFHAGIDRVQVDLEDVPQVLIDAVIAAEDRDFFTHGGVDPIGIARALWQDLRAGGFEQGASTITQQYVRTEYLTTERTITRKLKEAILAIKVEQELSKEEILERYLNTAYLGRGAYGIAAAARTYFGHSLSEVDVPEAAYLAGLLRSPEDGDAVRDPEEATRRRHTVLQAMFEEGYIGQAEFDSADAEEWVVATRADGGDGTIMPRRVDNRFGSVRTNDFGMEYYRDFVYEQLRALGYTDDQIYTGGLRIYTALDMHAQQLAWQAVTSTLDQPGDPLAAVVAIDQQGFVRAIVGGRDYATSQNNLATGSGTPGRFAGSAMKPFVLAAALEQGISLNSLFNAPAEVIVPGADNGADWVVNNYEDAELGILRVLDGTRVSSNTLFAQLIMAVGPDKVAEMATRMGITSPLAAVPSLTLGSSPVTPFEMAVAYSTLARGGVYISPQVITHVEWPDGRVDTFPPQTYQAIDPAYANQINAALRRVVGNGTGANATLSKQAAGKTGTTGNYQDAWFVGYVANGLTAAVWMGYDVITNPDGTRTPQFMTNVHGRPVTGGFLPAMVWRRFMEPLTEGIDTGAFPRVDAYPGRILNEGIDTTTTLPPTTAPLPLPPCGAPPTTTDPTQPCTPG
jgi:membrane peptidoglycan carboxypeptidase